jgi:steroid delta-isomerase-like uncharacterized protein
VSKIVSKGNVNLIVEFWAAVDENPDGDLERFFADDYRRHSFSADLAKADFLKIVREQKQSFPDLRSTIVDSIEQGDKIAYRWKSEGTHTISYRNVPPTNKKAIAEGITISRIVDGRISEEWSSWDVNSVLTGLGIFRI